MLGKNEEDCSDPAERSRKTMRVLVVDDEPDMREMHKLALETAGCMCDTAENGHDALILCAINDYDLILMDCAMPVMDGCQTTEHIRCSPRNASVPIVAYTGRAELMDRCVSSGMDAFVVKPTPLRELLEVISCFIPLSTDPNGADSNRVGSRNETSHADEPGLNAMDFNHPCTWHGWELVSRKDMEERTSR